MSTVSQLNSVCFAMRKLWTEKDGAIAILRGRDGTELYRVCSGSISNPNIIAERCKIWSGGTKVYDNLLIGADIAKGIDTSAVCYADIMTVKMLENSNKRHSICCGRKCAKCSSCELRC